MAVVAALRRYRVATDVMIAKRGKAAPQQRPL
jgi:hypothetical protein